MSENKRDGMFPRIMITITNAENQKKLTEVFASANTPISYLGHGHGTAPSAVMDVLGLSGRSKLIAVTLTTKDKVEKLFSELDSRLGYSNKGKGIAITVPVTGLQSKMTELLDNDANVSENQTDKGEKSNMSENEGYVAIWVSVLLGYSTDVLEVARNAGARGGTIMKGLRKGSEEAAATLGFASNKEERDFIFIVAKKEQKKAIMSAISEKCGINSEAHGIVMSLPIDEVLGLE